MTLTHGTFLACALLALCGTAKGAVVTGSSSANFIGLDVDIDVLLGVGIDAQIGTIPTFDNAPGPYSDSAGPSAFSQVSGSVTVPLAGTIATVANVGASAITSTVSSNVDGGVGTRLASADHLITGLNLIVGDLPVAADLISITAESIDVTSEVSGDFGALGATGTLSVVNLAVSVAGVPVPILYGGSLVTSLTGTIAPNFGVDLSTALLGNPLLGATLTLNEQTLGGDGSNTRSLTTNAIHLNLDAVALTDPTGLGLDIGSLTGDVRVGETFASLGAAAVPEPSSAMLLGLVCVGGVWVRHRSKRKATPTLES